MAASLQFLSSWLRSLLVIAFATALVARGGEMRRVEFPGGASAVRLSGSITGREFTDFQLQAEQGQWLSTALTSSNTFTYHNILRPDNGSEAIFIGSTSGEAFQGVIPSTGEFILRVYLMRNAAPRGERADFKLLVELTTPPKSSALPSRGGCRSSP